MSTSQDSLPVEWYALFLAGALWLVKVWGKFVNPVKVLQWFVRLIMAPVIREFTEPTAKKVDYICRVLNHVPEVDRAIKTVEEEDAEKRRWDANGTPAHAGP